MYVLYVRMLLLLLAIGGEGVGRGEVYIGWGYKLGRKKEEQKTTPKKKSRRFPNWRVLDKVATHSTKPEHIKQCY